MAKTLTGIVSSNKTDKTIVVTIHTRKTHPLYKKQYTVTNKVMAHDEKNEAQVGDKVTIAETRPLSARKRYILTRVVERPLIREDAAPSAVAIEEVEQVKEKTETAEAAAGDEA